jgi:hypothetical protein
MADAPKKRRLYVVGGKGKNVPPWVTAAFDVEQFDQEHTRGREPNAANSPDAIVVLTSWVGHKHFFDGRDLAARLKIPLILSPGGWSASLKSAADLGAEWFIKDIENAKRSDALSEKEVADLTDYIDNAWREAYSREFTARAAMEKRHELLRKELEAAKSALADAATRQETANRVIKEVRAAAAQQREALDQAQAETGRMAEATRAKSERLSQALASQLEGIEGLVAQSALINAELHGHAQRITEMRFKVSEGLKELRNAINDVSDEASLLAGASSSEASA